MNNPIVFIGEPLKFQNIWVYPPKVREVVCAPNFSLYTYILTITQGNIADDFTEKKIDAAAPSPYEYLMINCHESAEFRKMAEEAFMFFIHQKPNFLYNEGIIVFGELSEVVQNVTSVDELPMLSKDNYFDFQNTIREVCGYHIEKPEEAPRPGEDPRIAAMKAKARRRDKLKAKQNSKNGINLMTSLAAICCMGIGFTPQNIGEMSYASIGVIMSMMQDKEKYETDIKSLLAGADPKKTKPKYWIRNQETE